MGTDEFKCLHVLREIVCLTQCRCFRKFGSVDLRIDSTNHVVEREKLSRHPDALWINREGVPAPSPIGATIRFHSTDGQEVSDLRQRCYGFRTTEVEYRGESCKSFNADIVSMHHVSYSEAKGISIEDGLMAGRTTPQFQAPHEECIEYLLGLCRKNHEEKGEVDASGREADESSSVTDSPQTRRQRGNRQERSVSDDGRLTYLVPSDHLTVFELEGTALVGVFISRFWVRRLDDERNVFLFLERDQNGKLSHFTTSTVMAPPLVKEPPKITFTSASEQVCQTTGCSEDGTKFYTYRILLYADDFNPRSTLFPKGSVGGLYMSPSGLSIRAKRSQFSIQTISLTPSGVSTNSVLEYFIEDLVTGSIDGFKCIDAFGEEVLVYFDVMGFLGYHPASSSVVDLKGHTATSTCTHCGLTCNKNKSKSKFAYTTSINLTKTSYRRTQHRTGSVRAAGMTKFQHQCLGMRAMDSESSKPFDNSPLLQFARAYNEKLDNTPAALLSASYRKDGYDLNLNAPDHLISGLFKGVLTIVFIQLQTDRLRDELQIYLKKSLSDFGFQTQSLLFHNKKKKLVPGLSMSVLYGILTVLPSTLEALNAFQSLPSKRLVQNLHRFFSTAFWWPSLITDGDKAWEFVHGVRMASYHRSLQVLVGNFVKSVNKFINLYPDLSSHIDRPNLHRLLELTYHTIPTFNHVTFVWELVFESAHQPLKFYLSRNHTYNAHISAVQLILAKDWMVRLWLLWRIYRGESETLEHRHYEFIGLLRLLVGEEVNKFNWKSGNLAAPREHVHDLMIGTVGVRFEKWYDDSKMTFNSDAKWILFKPSATDSLLEVQHVFLKNLSTRLVHLYMEEEKAVLLCNKALLDRGYGCTAKGAHERLLLGYVVQLLLTEYSNGHKFLTPFVSSKGTPHFFVVDGLFQSQRGTSFAAVQRCTLLSQSSVGQLPDCNRPPTLEVSKTHFYLPQALERTHYIEITQAATKVGVIHNCQSRGNDS